jgi:signal transduction histidine kinase/DNA-binding response OmpR family regulator
MSAAPNDQGRHTVKAGTTEALIASTDWSSSPLGPAPGWPGSLRTVLRLMLSSRYAMWMGWGRDLTFFCNDTYANQTLGAKYPWALGRTAREVWAEIWDDIGPLIGHVLRTGQATWSEGLLLLLERSGYPEETYHTFSYSPAPGDAPGEIAGLFCVVIEETERVISERRIALLGSFASLLSKTQTPGEVFAAVENCLTEEARDLPFSLTYLFDPDGKTATRVAATGFDEGHAAAPVQVIVDGPTPWPLSAIRASGGPVVVDLDASTSGAAWPLGPWKLAPSRALLLPIARQGENRIAGVFVAGLNPHRPLDDAMRNFVQLFVGQLTAGLSNAFAYEEAHKRADALAELDRAKTTFFSNVSHEFRTPLTLMLAPIEDMRASLPPSAEEAGRVELLHRNALRLLKLVNTLLDFSRIEAGRVEAVYEETDLSALTTDLASNFRSALDRAGLELVVDCAPLGESVFVDRGMWEKIVLNLLSNAFKFTFEGKITVRSRLVADHAELEIADTGIGIAAHELPRLFERFHRIEGAKSRSHEGSGIGLALVHDLVSMHAGEIDVASRPGAGTTFRVRIPRGRKHLSDERIHAARTLESTALGVGAYVAEALRWIGPAPGEPTAQWTAPGAGAARPRLVVADDNADMLDYLTRLLRERWDVEAVMDGLAALEAIRRAPPDLVLTDVMMPGLGGFGLLEALRSDANLRSIPVVLLSARAGEEATAEALKAGADDYIVKPFSARDLLVRVTARLAAAKAAQEAIEQRRNLYRHFMQAPFPISIYKGSNHVIELVNAACLRAWGKSASIVGLPVAEALPEIQGQGFLEEVEGVYRTAVPYEGRELLVRLPTGPDGELEDAYYTFVYAPLFDARGVVEGVLTCGFEITDSVVARQKSDRTTKEAAAAKERALQDAELTNRAKDEFLATMSHELRTPLNAILGWAGLLKGDSSDPGMRQRGLDVIERNARTQSRLVSDLLDVSRVISGKLNLTVKKLQVATVIQAAVDVVRHAAEAKKVHLFVDVDPDVGAIIGDPDRLQQVVWNLLSNAVRFTPANGRVTLTARRPGSEVVVQVQDTGAGILPQHLTLIFDRFKQVDSSITRAHGGLGLGLSIVRHLVEAHGGTVSAASEGPGKGALFTVVLPIHAVSVPSASAGETDAKGGAAGRESPLQHDLDGVRVLVVDDERDSLDLVRLVLEGSGASVTTVSSATEALDARGPFDVIISDIGMPEVDGYTFMRRLRSQDAEARVPAIALTAYARVEDAERALRAGFQQHLAKPVDAYKLLEIVDTWAHAGPGHRAPE